MAALPMRTLAIRTFAISAEQFELVRPILDSSDFTNVSICDDGEITAWRRWLWSPHVWAFSIGLSLMSAILFALTAFKVTKHIRHFGFANIPAICMFLHGIALLILFLLWGVDPLGRNQLFSSALSEGLRVVAVPFTCSAVILLIFHWWRVLKPAHLRLGTDIDRYRIAASISIFLLFALTGLSILNRSIGMRLYSPIWAFNITLIILSLPIMLFFLITSLRVLRTIFEANRNVLSIESQLQHHVEDDTQSMNLLRGTALKIVGISIGLCASLYLLFIHSISHASSFAGLAS
jgi:hypothetical protein